jgi:hypothetical protein
VVVPAYHHAVGKQAEGLYQYRMVTYHPVSAAAAKADIVDIFAGQ